MAAAVTVTPAEVQVGDLVTIDCTGFAASHAINVQIPEMGIDVDGVTDVAGEFSTVSQATKATGTLTITAGNNAIAAETVTLDGVVYTFRAAVTTTANEVKVGANGNASLDALKAAVNADGNTSVYGSNTTANPTIGAGARGNLTLGVFARAGGTAGNSLATTETMTQGSFANTTLISGAAASGNDALNFHPEEDEPFTVVATDGTTTVTVRVPVHTA